MDRSSTGVDPSELYDGPVPAGNVEHFPGSARFVPLPDPPTSARAKPEYAAILTAALDTISARLLGLIATVAACGMWGFAVFDPQVPRTYAAVGFSLTVLLPLVALYWRRG